MKSSIAVLAFLIRHLLFVMLAMVAGCVVWTLVYAALLAIAVLTNQGLGGPLAYPAGILSVLGACVVIGWGVFTPSSAIGAIFCRVFRLPRLAAIPVVWLTAFGFFFVLHRAFVVSAATHPLPNLGNVLAGFATYLSLPLGVYWWLTEGPGALFDLFRRWVVSRRQRRELDSPSDGTGAR